MVVVRLQGGLGNQMFQVAAGLRLARRHEAECKVDIGLLLNRRSDLEYTPRDFDLVIYPRPPAVASEAEVRGFRRLLERDSRSLLERLIDKVKQRQIFVEKSMEFDSEVLELPDETYLEGFFQSERYFRDAELEVRDMFRLVPATLGLSAETVLLGNQISEEGGICLHVRRGDYVSNPITSQHHGVCAVNYYRNGLERLKSVVGDRQTYIFSDDLPWCASAFPEKSGFTIVGPEHAGYRAGGHLWLMTRCHHFVIANSSFSWWAAWLSQSCVGKRVVRPAQWFRAPTVEHIDICPPSWERVSND